MKTKRIISSLLAFVTVIALPLAACSSKSPPPPLQMTATPVPAPAPASTDNIEAIVADIKTALISGDFIAAYAHAARSEFVSFVEGQPGTEYHTDDGFNAAKGADGGIMVIFLDVRSGQSADTVNGYEYFFSSDYLAEDTATGAPARLLRCEKSEVTLGKYTGTYEEYWYIIDGWRLFLSESGAMVNGGYEGSVTTYYGSGDSETINYTNGYDGVYMHPDDRMPFPAGEDSPDVSRLTNWGVSASAVPTPTPTPPPTINSAIYITYEQAEKIAEETAFELNANFAAATADYRGMSVNPEISAAEQYHMFWFGYFFENGYQTTHAAEEMFVYVGEISGDAYYYDFSTFDWLWVFHRQHPSAEKLPYSWESAYRETLTMRRDAILGYGGNPNGVVALQDVTTDGVPELFFIAANGKPHNEADLVIYTYYDGKAVELFESPTYRGTQMGPAVVPFMSGDDFWLWMFESSETGISEEYRRYILADGAFTVAQTIPIEYRQYTEPGGWTDYERLVPTEAQTLDRLLDKQAERLLEDSALSTGWYEVVYRFLVR